MSNKPKVSVIVQLEDDLVAQLRAVCDVHDVGSATSRPDVLEGASGAEGVLLSTRVQVNAEFFDAAPNVRVISTTSVGYDAIDVAEATRRGVVVCHTPGVLTNAVTDLTMSLIFALALKLFPAEAFVRSDGWARNAPTQPGLGMDIRGKTLGVIGFGRIGQEVTRRMQGIGMRTIWYDIFDTPFPGAPESEYRPLDQLLTESDFVTLHTNLTESSHHMISTPQLEMMKPSAFLVNTARGGLVDQDALVRALESGQIAGAGLDVLEREPPLENEPIVTLPNVICFPHIGSATEETRRAMRELAVLNLLSALAGKRPPAPVNPEVLG